MASIELNFDNFASKVSNSEIILVDWYADWCGPCKQFSPIFENASKKHSDLTFGKVNTEEQQELSAEARIRSIPTLMAFRDGILVHSQAGALSARDFERLIEDVRKLDMDQVRTDIARKNNAPLN